MRSLLRAAGPLHPSNLVARSSDHRDLVCINASALGHMLKHRQRRFFSTEAGGQIFGILRNSVLTIVDATGPYPGDHRSRFAYRSDPVKAQSAISAQAATGRCYLGEWHTHAEDRPEPSSSDRFAMQGLIQASRMPNSDIFLLIVGRIDGPAGLALFSFAGASTSRWEFE